MPISSAHDHQVPMIFRYPFTWEGSVDNILRCQWLFGAYKLLNLQVRMSISSAHDRQMSLHTGGASKSPLCTVPPEDLPPGRASAAWETDSSSSLSCSSPTPGTACENTLPRPGSFPPPNIPLRDTSAPQTGQSPSLFFTRLSCSKSDLLPSIMNTGRGLIAHIAWWMFRISSKLFLFVMLYTKRKISPHIDRLFPGFDSLGHSIWAGK